MCRCGYLGGPFDAVYMEVRKAILSKADGGFDGCQAEIVSAAVDAVRKHDSEHVCGEKEQRD